MSIMGFPLRRIVNFFPSFLGIANEHCFSIGFGLFISFSVLLMTSCGESTNTEVGQESIKDSLVVEAELISMSDTNDYYASTATSTENVILLRDSGDYRAKVSYSREDIYDSDYYVETQSYEIKEKGCESCSIDVGDCNFCVQFEVPQLEGPNQAATESINRYIENLIRKMVVSNIDDTTFYSWEELINKVIREHELLSQKSLREGGWYVGIVSIDYTEHFIFRDIYTLSVNWDIHYTRTAHPNGGSSTYWFDLKTGHVIEDVLSRFDKDKLLYVAERNFREDHDMSLDEPLDELWDFVDGEFYLPHNVELRDDGLNFVYNRYEIAGYVMGPVYLFIPYSEVDYIENEDENH